MAPPPPELNTDVVSEILLRLPPDDPAGLVRASAVCKPWLRTLTDPAFLRRYRDFHGTPRVLGLLQNTTGFVPITAFRPHAAAAAHRTCYVLDCRHGRALLYDSGSKQFVVWDPVTGRERRIPYVDEDPYAYSNHAVLCAAGAGCDHSTCSGGPFLLASAGSRCNNVGETCACFYSSETGAWSAQTTLHHSFYYSLEERPAALVGGALYFHAYTGGLLRYDVLGGRGLLLLGLPPGSWYLNTIVMTTGNGGLGLATYDDGMLALWSAETGPNRDFRWSHIKLINLQKLLPIDSDTTTVWLSGFAEDANVIFLSTADNGIFTIELKSLLTRKVSEMHNVDDHVFPYVSFYNPAGFKFPDNESLSEEKSQRKNDSSSKKISQSRESDGDARSSEDSMPGSPRTMDNKQWYGEEEVVGAGAEPPTKGQKKGS